MQLFIQKHAIASAERVSGRFGRERCGIVIINIFKSTRLWALTVAVDRAVANAVFHNHSLPGYSCVVMARCLK